MQRAIGSLVCAGVALTAMVAPAVADLTIYDIQGYGAVTPGNPVDVDGVVVTGIYAFGFMAQEPDEDAGSSMFGRTYGGIWVYTGGAPDVEFGDLVDLEGEYQEFFDESEIDVTVAGSSVMIVGTAPQPPYLPVVITDINDELAGEPWEGVLIETTQPNMVSTDTLNTGCGSASPTRWGVYQTSAPTDSLFVRNSVTTHEIPIPGSPISYLRGPMSFHRCLRKVIPRDNDDIGYIAAPNIVWAYSTGNTSCDIVFSRDVTQASAEDVLNYFFASGVAVLAAERDASDFSVVHLTTSTQFYGIQDELFAFDIQSEGGAVMPAPQSFQFFTDVLAISDVQFVDDPVQGADQSEFLNGVVTCVGVATSSTIAAPTSDYFFADAAGAWSGIAVDLIGEEVEIGDMVMVSGRITESFGRTNFQYTGFGRSVNLGPGTPIAPTALAPGDVPYQGVPDSEPYESVLVTVQNAVLDTVPGGWPFGEYFMIDNSPAPGDSAMLDVSESTVCSDFMYMPAIGDEGDFTGVLNYSFSNYRLTPRCDDDIDVTAAAVGIVTTPTALGLGNHPNPFNPTTTIAFRLTDATRVDLEVYEPSGRVVRTLMAGVDLDAGEHEVAWDGMDDTGLPVASGTYFYRVIADGRQAATRTMTLLK